MDSEKDIVEVLRGISNEVATSSGDAGEILLSEAEKAAATIEVLRAEVKAKRSYYGSNNTNLAVLMALDKAVEIAENATDAAGALGKEGSNGQ